MAPPTCGVTYVDGLPGLGKSTAVAALAAHCPGLAMVSENNPLPSQEHELAALNPAAVSQWYMAAEARRARYIAQLAGRGAIRSHGQQPAHVMCDKSALSVLAYVFASTRVGLIKDSDYTRLRDQYLVGVRPHLPPHARTILFSGSISLGLDRRHDKPDRATRPLWFDPAFLHAQEQFFRDHVTELLGHPVQQVNADVPPETMSRALANLAGVQLIARLAPIAAGDRAAAALLEEAATTIGEAVLGRRIGHPFHQFGYIAQAHERHLLHLRDPAYRDVGSLGSAGGDGGAEVRLQAQDWQPSTSRPAQPVLLTVPHEGTEG